MNALIEAHFLPSLEYCCLLASCESVVLERHEHFVKQTLRNRCYIMTAQGTARLSLPVTDRHGKADTGSVRLDYSERWPDNLWRTLTSAYARSAYFEYYSDELRAALFSREPFLFNLNTRLLSICLRWLKLPTQLSESSSYQQVPENGLYDLRNTISDKSDFSTRQFYRPEPYTQVFGNNFAPNLSVMDLVCCEGPLAASIIKKSIAQANH